MKAWRVFVWLAFVGVIIGYYLLWSKVPSSVILSYTATRDAIIFNTFVALGFGALVLWTAWDHISVAGSWPRQVLYFLFIAIMLGVLNLNRLPAITFADSLMGVGWDDVPATGLIASIQTVSLLFALTITLIRYRFDAVKGK